VYLGIAKVVRTGDSRVSFEEMDNATSAFGSFKFTAMDIP